MIKRTSSLVKGNGLMARALRGSALTFVSFGGAQVLRLVSNLILTRILFPEAFGMMALVQVFLSALEMFSDTGINASIIQNKRGDEPNFLNTAWTVQILRGILLWLCACALAGPAATLYGQEQLRQLLPVMGFSAVITGFLSTKAATANRHLQLGRLTLIELGSQAIGIVVMVLLALWLQSVWALVFGPLFSATLKICLSHVALNGERNRLHWDSSAFSELFSFGKYIFLSSMAGFLINTGDRAILGKFVTLTELAVYNIAFFLASVPLVLYRKLGGKVMFPLYAAKPPSESAHNKRQLSKARFLLSTSMFALALFLGLAGDWMVRFMYEPAYHLAGPIMVLLSVSILPTLISASYSNALLAKGNSRDFTILLITIATVQTLTLYFGVQAFGLLGAITAPPLATLVTYPLMIRLVQRQQAWDPLHDAVFAGLSVVGLVLVLWVNDTALAQVMQGTVD